MISRRQFLQIGGAALAVAAVTKVVPFPESAEAAHGLLVSPELVADGGFLVPQEFMAALMAAAEDGMIMRGHTHIIPLGAPIDD